MSRLPVLVAVGDAQSLQKLAKAADKMASIMLKETTINLGTRFLSKINSVKYKNIWEVEYSMEHYGKGFCFVVHHK